MTSSTQSISSFGSVPSPILNQASTPTSYTEDRCKALAAVKRSIAQAKALRESDKNLIQKSYTVQSSSTSASCSSSLNSTVSPSSLPGTKYAHAVAVRSIATKPIPPEIQSDISYIVVGAFSVYPYVPLTTPILPLYPSSDVDSQTTTTSSTTLSSILGDDYGDPESPSIDELSDSDVVTEKSNIGTNT